MSSEDEDVAALGAALALIQKKIEIHEKTEAIYLYTH